MPILITAISHKFGFEGYHYGYLSGPGRLEGWFSRALKVVPLSTGEVFPWGSMSVNNTWIGSQSLEIVLTLGYLALGLWKRRAVG